MDRKFLQKFGLICLLLLSVACAKAPIQQFSDYDLYRLAVQDSVWAEESEIYPLVALTPNSDMVTFSQDGKQVLLLSWNKKANLYLEGSEIELGNGEVWTFTDKEIIQWYQNNDQVTDWNLRFKQLIGLPLSSSYTHFTAFWVNLDDILRPAYVSDIQALAMYNRFVQEPNQEFKQWFDGNILFSYFYSEYPWTRLGYTYDWADNGTEYGLSEFIIKPHSKVKIAWTKSTEDFLNWLAKQE